jgi:hypothetical protein
MEESVPRERAAGLIPKKPIAHHHPRALSQEAVERILELRKTYCLCPQRIAWYLERYHSIKVSSASVYRTLVRHALSRLPRHVGRRAVHTHRYAKEVPGHHVQSGVIVRERIVHEILLNARMQFEKAKPGLPGVCSFSFNTARKPDLHKNSGNHMGYEGEGHVRFPI